MQGLGVELLPSTVWAAGSIVSNSTNPEAIKMFIYRKLTEKQNMAM